MQNDRTWKMVAWGVVIGVIAAFLYDYLKAHFKSSNQPGNPPRRYVFGTPEESPSYVAGIGTGAGCGCARC